MERFLNHLRHLGSFLLILVISWGAQAEQPWATSVDGRLFRGGTSTPLKDASLVFVIQIMNPSRDCVLYEETQTYDTEMSNGYFSLKVGSRLPDLSGRRTANDPGYAMSRIFNNTLNSFPPSAGCGAGYTPGDGDARYLRVSIKPSGGVMETLSPDIAVASVPSAKVAETVGGLERSQILNVNNTGINRVNMTNLESVFNTTQLPILNALLGGTSSMYMRQGSNGTAVVPGISGNASSASAGQIWYDTASNQLKYQSNSGPQTLGVAGSGVTSVSAGTGLNVGAGPGGSITTTGTLNVNVGTSDGQIVQVQTGGKLPALNASDLTNVNGSAVQSGTIGGTTAINTSGNIATTGTLNSGAITSSGNISGVNLTATNSVTANDARLNALRVYKPSTANYVEFVADAALSAPVVFTLPTALGTNGQILQTDASGKLSWTSISNAPGGAAGGDLGGSYPNPLVNAVRGNAVASGTLAVGDTGKVYRWSGTQFEAVNFGVDDLRTETGFQQFAANCGADQTLTWSTITDAFACTTIGIAGTQITSGTINSARLPTIDPTKGGTGLTALGTSNQLLGVNNAGSAMEYKSITGGAGVTITHSAGGIQVSATGSGGTVTGVTAGTGLNVDAGPGGTISGSGTLNIDVGTTAGKIVQVAAGDKLPVIDGSNLTNLNASNIATGILPIARGGTGQTTAGGALNALLPSQSLQNGKVLQTDGTNASWVTPNAGTVTNVSGTAPISVTNNTTTPSIVISQANTTTDGYLSSTDWNTFNSKQPAGSYVTALAGDVVATGPGSAAATIQANAITTSKINNLAVTDAKINDVAWSKVTGVPALLSAVNTGGTGNQVFGMNAAGTAGEYKSITGGAGVTITHSVNGIQVSATGSGGTVTNVTGSAPISVTNNTSTPAITISQANGSMPGYLSAADWTTFNNKQPAGNYLTALTGDVVATGPGSGSATIQASAITTSKINNLAVTDAKINDVAWSKVTGTPTTLSGYGITDNLVANGGGTPSVSSGLEASRPVASTAGRLYVATDTKRVFRDTGVLWEQLNVNASDLTSGTLAAARLPALTGDVTMSAGTNSVTLNTVPTTKGGTGLTTTGTGNQVLGMNNAGTAMEYKSITGGAGVTITHSAGGIQVAATGSGGTVTSVTAGTGLTGGTITGSGTIGLGTELTGLNGLSTTGFVKRTGAGAYATSAVSLGTDVSGTLPIANGGTGQTTANAALNALLPTQVLNTGKVLQTDGSNTSWVTPNAGTVTNVTGTAPISVTSNTTTPSIVISQAST